MGSETDPGAPEPAERPGRIHALSGPEMVWRLMRPSALLGNATALDCIGIPERRRRRRPDQCPAPLAHGISV